MRPWYEGSWWSARSGTRPSLAHLVLLHLSGGLLLQCERWSDAHRMRPRLPVDRMCPDCLAHVGRTCTQGVQWLNTLVSDQHCGRCASVIPAGVSVALVPGELLCAACVGRMREGTRRQ